MTSAISSRTPRRLGVAYLLFFLLGGFNAHRIYLGHTVYAIGFIVFYWGALWVFTMSQTGQHRPGLSTGGLIAVIILAGCLVSLIIDLIRMHSLVDEANARQSAP